MKFKRVQSIESACTPGRILIIYGPRRVGKTTLLTGYLSQQTRRTLLLSGDELRLHELFTKRSISALAELVAPYDIVAIDEAQQLPYIGQNAKLLIDNFPDKQFLLTGSSSFSLAQQTGEPLVGRHFALLLLPIAQSEIMLSKTELRWSLPQFLRFGSYPEVLLASDDHMRKRILRELASSYLYKDILAFHSIRNPALVRDIAKMLALQIGQEVSLNEIATAVGSSVKTVAHYLDVLEQMFVIKKVTGFSRNLRNEITKKARYYFLDNGVRNAIIDQFAEPELRADVGALWENFVFSELLKKETIADSGASFYFWRTHAGSEIDIIIEKEGRLFAYECKWSSRRRTKPPCLFTDTYPHAHFHTATPDSYLSLLLGA